MKFLSNKLSNKSVPTTRSSGRTNSNSVTHHHAPRSTMEGMDEPIGPAPPPPPSSTTRNTTRRPSQITPHNHPVHQHHPQHHNASTATPTLDAVPRSSHTPFANPTTSINDEDGEFVDVTLLRSHQHPHRSSPALVTEYQNSSRYNDNDTFGNYYYHARPPKYQRYSTYAAGCILATVCLIVVMNKHQGPGGISSDGNSKGSMRGSGSNVKKQQMVCTRSVFLSGLNAVNTLSLAPLNAVYNMLTNKTLFADSEIRKTDERSAKWSYGQQQRGGQSGSRYVHCIQEDVDDDALAGGPGQAAARKPAPKPVPPPPKKLNPATAGHGESQLVTAAMSAIFPDFMSNWAASVGVGAKQTPEELRRQRAVQVSENIRKEAVDIMSGAIRFIERLRDWLLDMLDRVINTILLRPPKPKEEPNKMNKFADIAAHYLYKVLV